MTLIRKSFGDLKNWLVLLMVVILSFNTANRYYQGSLFLFIIDFLVFFSITFLGLFLLCFLVRSLILIYKGMKTTREYEKVLKEEKELKEKEDKEPEESEARKWD